MNKEILIAANTPQGFVSYFDRYINADKVICLKGGSGVGKSTLLKGVITLAERNNLSVITMPCSSDSKSLDMVVVGDNQIVVLDATAPHVIEPPCYGAQGEIFNLGDCLDKSYLRDVSQELKSLMSEKSLHYAALYNHLRAASCHLDNIGLVYKNALKIDMFRGIYNTIISDYLQSAVPAAREIEGFNSYLDCREIIDCAGHMIEARVAIKLKCASGCIAREMIGNIAQYLQCTGVICEKYHCLLAPNELESVATYNIFITATQKIDADYVIDLDAAIDNARVGHRIVDIIDERGSCNREIAKAGDRLRASRECHGEIEKHYIHAMDFDKLERAKAVLLGRLLT